MSTWGPLVERRTSTTYTRRRMPSTYSSPLTCSPGARKASVASLPEPMRRLTPPERGSMRVITPVSSSCSLEENSS